MLSIDRHPCRNALLIKIAEKGSKERYNREFDESETEEEAMMMKRMIMIIRYTGEIKSTIAELETLIKLKMTKRFDIDAARQNRDLIMQKLQIGA